MILLCIYAVCFRECCNMYCNLKVGLLKVKCIKRIYWNYVQSALYVAVAEYTALFLILLLVQILAGSAFFSSALPFMDMTFCMHSKYMLIINIYVLNKKKLQKREKNKLKLRICGKLFNIVLDCQPGYFGYNCIHKCRFPSYGLYCQNICDCDARSCDKETGCKIESKFIMKFHLNALLNL